MFEIGQKVVCVSDTYAKGDIVVGQVYTVKVLDYCCMLWVGIGTPDDGNGNELCPYCGKKCPCDNEVLFDWWHFRPLDALEEQLHEIETQPAELELA